MVNRTKKRDARPVGRAPVDPELGSPARRPARLGPALPRRRPGWLSPAPVGSRAARRARGTGKPARKPPFERPGHRPLAGVGRDVGGADIWGGLVPPECGHRVLLSWQSCCLDKFGQPFCCCGSVPGRALSPPRRCGPRWRSCARRRFPSGSRRSRRTTWRRGPGGGRRRRVCGQSSRIR